MSRFHVNDCVTFNSFVNILKDIKIQILFPGVKGDRKGTWNHNGFHSRLWNSALLNLSRHFTDESMVQILGLQVLKLPEHQVASIWNKHKPNANLAAHELLKKFELKYKNHQEASYDLLEGLCKNGLNKFASLFEQWLEGNDD